MRRRKAERIKRPIEFRALTPDRWPDLERLFGPHGACAGCWCMWWRVSRAEFGRMSSQQRRAAFRRIVASRGVPGILAYIGGEPAAWCAVAPREAHPALERSPVLARVDDKPTWSIVCLFVGRAFRSRGITLPLIRAAVAHARAGGARLVEAYPTATTGRLDAPSAYLGTVRMYRRAGFRVVKRPSPRRRIVRYWVTKLRR